jgi:hypothetical protein
MCPEALIDTSSREPGNDIQRRPIMKVKTLKDYEILRPKLIS